MGKPEENVELMMPVVTRLEFNNDPNDDWELPEARFNSPASPAPVALVLGAKMLGNNEAAGVPAAVDAALALLAAPGALGVGAGEATRTKAGREPEPWWPGSGTAPPSC